MDYDKLIDLFVKRFQELKTKLDEDKSLKVFLSYRDADGELVEI